jgi:hypothetical protein
VHPIRPSCPPPLAEAATALRRRAWEAGWTRDTDGLAVGVVRQRARQARAREHMRAVADMERKTERDGERKRGRDSSGSCLSSASHDGRLL